MTISSLAITAGSLLVSSIASAGFIPAPSPTPTPAPTAVSPTFSPSAGTYSTSQSVTITSSTAGAKICYRIDGADPTATAGSCDSGSSTYSSPVLVSSNITIRAIATKSGYADSAVVSAAYVISSAVRRKRVRVDQ